MKVYGDFGPVLRVDEWWMLVVVCCRGVVGGNVGLDDFQRLGTKKGKL